MALYCHSRAALRNRQVGTYVVALKGVGELATEPQIWTAFRKWALPVDGFLRIIGMFGAAAGPVKWHRRKATFRDQSEVCFFAGL